MSSKDPVDGVGCSSVVGGSSLAVGMGSGVGEGACVATGMLAGDCMLGGIAEGAEIAMQETTKILMVKKIKTLAFIPVNVSIVHSRLAVGCHLQHCAKKCG